MNIKRREFVVGAAVGGAMLTFRAYAQDAWPAKSIRIVVPFPPGGSTDILGRRTADYLQKSFNVPVIVENLPGATGTIGTAAVARASPDGYTLLMGSIGTVVTNHFVYDNLPFKLSAFDPIINIAETPNVVIVRAGLPVHSVQELIDYMKAHPGKLNYGSPGLASSSHVSTELFKLRAGVQGQHVPYKGSTPMLADLMGESIDFTIDNISSSLELIKSNKLRAIAVTSRARSPLLPMLPTMIEAGMPGYVMAPWFCVAAPTGTPPTVIEKLNSTLNAMLKDAGVRGLLESYGATPVGGSTEQIRALIASEARTIESLARQVNFKPT
ncbi:tripartite tricarboxylate transporter substrate binding protein [Bordetella sp. 15P40C-2]|uniref:Bug family tripartite tricarboxylate transporter substrate binding protein n=1 Tax=Bordetella sp. 15P40C-2 TaxID=2572246 RepID=UPI00132590B5|nr:tripartite tricarboxylate transporter substrate binding protein [Bordetella sp. 15P40C-2]MVW72815.1 tripartite tricarboxylate transporter substrate binding protein [Bordetella sp. 15P40C-2]